MNTAYFSYITHATVFMCQYINAREKSEVASTLHCVYFYLIFILMKMKNNAMLLPTPMTGWCRPSDLVNIQMLFFQHSTRIWWNGRNVLQI